MQRKTKWWLAGGVVAIALIAGGTSIGLAASRDDKPLTGSTRDKAVANALDETRGGTVTETEVGDDGTAYSVEIRLQDGREVEVNLDRDFKVIGQEGDDDGSRDND